MDSGYLKREEIKIEKGEEDTKKIENIIEKEKTRKDSNLIDKSLYFNSFEDLSMGNHNNTNNTNKDQNKSTFPQKNQEHIK